METQPAANEAPAAQAAPTEAPKREPKASKAKPAKKPVKAAPKKAKPVKKAKAKAKGDGLTGPAILQTYAKTYHHDKTKKTASGNVSVDSNDGLAQKLRGKPLEEVYAAAAKVLKDEDDNPLTVNKLKAKYGHLNVGMQRMNLGNRMRAVLNAK